MKYNLEVPIKEALFPGLQGGPHNNAIGGVCVALGQALKPEFKDYQVQVGKPQRAIKNPKLEKMFGVKRNFGVQIYV